MGARHADALLHACNLWRPHYWRLVRGACEVSTTYMRLMLARRKPEEGSLQMKTMAI